MNWNSEFWLAWNWFTFFPLVICVVYRFLTRVDYSKGGVTCYTLDTVCRFLLAPSLIYYTIDSFELVYKYHLFGWCNFGFLLHHIVTLAGYRASITLTHYPWFFLAAFPCHCLLIMFPYHTDLNYLYLAIILNCLYNFTKDPWKNDEKCKWITLVVLTLLAGPIVILWLFECKNDMMNLT